MMPRHLIAVIPARQLYHTMWSIATKMTGVGWIYVDSEPKCFLITGKRSDSDFNNWLRF